VDLTKLNYYLHSQFETLKDDLHSDLGGVFGSGSWPEQELALIVIFNSIFRNYTAVEKFVKFEREYPKPCFFFK
jgi:hypothetical protein